MNEINNSGLFEIKFKSYLIGFILSVFLTLFSYILVVRKVFSADKTILIIVITAIVQFSLQLIFFLHINKKAKKSWQLSALIFMIIVVFILVFGSIWIMYNLNRRMMPTNAQVNNYLKSQGGGGI